MQHSAEANEGAIKLAKKYQVEKGNKNKIEFVTLKNSFHGRTLATVAATGQPKYQAPYQPLIEKFVHIDRDDISALENAVNENTAGIMIELIQGESGVNPVSREFAEKAAELCGKNDIALIVDEVQTGIGRTGKLFAYELYDLEPDIVTMAKGLGGGVPIGAFAPMRNLLQRLNLVTMEPLSEETLCQPGPDWWFWMNLYTAEYWKMSERQVHTYLIN